MSSSSSRPTIPIHLIRHISHDDLYNNSEDFKMAVDELRRLKGEIRELKREKEDLEEDVLKYRREAKKLRDKMGEMGKSV
jgi:predicted transcriptional regulator